MPGIGHLCLQPPVKVLGAGVLMSPSGWQHPCVPLQFVVEEGSLVLALGSLFLVSNPRVSSLSQKWIIALDSGGTP